jgi:hypothetical protein
MENFPATCLPAVRFRRLTQMISLNLRRSAGSAGKQTTLKYLKGNICFYSKPAANYE